MKQKKLTFLNKMWLLASAIVLGNILISSVAFYVYKESLIDSGKNEIKTVLQFALNHALVYIEQANEGLITREHAEEEVIEILSRMQEGYSYVWANDNNAIARVHIRPEKIGKYQRSYRDAINRLESEPIAFVVDSNIKPVIDRRVLKINGVVKIPEWDWVVGYGVYLDDISHKIWGFVIVYLSITIGALLTVLSILIYTVRSTKNVK